MADDQLSNDGVPDSSSDVSCTVGSATGPSSDEYESDEASRISSAELLKLKNMHQSNLSALISQQPQQLQPSCSHAVFTQGTETAHGQRKTTRGKQKIPITFMQDRCRRYSTFSKRKTGLIKKSVELAKLTGAEVLLLIASKTNHVYTYATDRLKGIIESENGKQLIKSCLETQPEVTDMSGSIDMHDSFRCEADLEGQPAPSVEKVFENLVTAQPNTIGSPGIESSSSDAGPILVDLRTLLPRPSGLPQVLQVLDQKPVSTTCSFPVNHNGTAVVSCAPPICTVSTLPLVALSRSSGGMDSLISTSLLPAVVDSTRNGDAAGLSTHMEPQLFSPLPLGTLSSLTATSGELLVSVPYVPGLSSQQSANLTIVNSIPAHFLLQANQTTPQR